MANIQRNSHDQDENGQYTATFDAGWKTEDKFPLIKLQGPREKDYYDGGDPGSKIINKIFMTAAIQV